MSKIDSNATKQLKISYYTKTSLTCPVCSSQVRKEELLSGSGRLIAGKLTDELHRTYEKTKKYGFVYPLVYSLPICQECYFTAFTSEWDINIKTLAIDDIRSHLTSNYRIVKELFPSLNFEQPRRLQEGISSYILALLNYEVFPKENLPVFKQALCAIRAAWLSNDLDSAEPNNYYYDLAGILYRKASFYYRRACELEEMAEQSFTKISFLGPDQDHNFDFDGVLYLAGLLEFKYGSRSNAEVRKHGLAASLTTISKIVGSGKASKNKPKDILDLSRVLYQSIKDELALLSQD